MLQLLLNKCGTVCGWMLTALFNGSWTFFAVPSYNCDETKNKNLLKSTNHNPQKWLLELALKKTCLLRGLLGL